jgi:WD40 repeat protein
MRPKFFTLRNFILLILAAAILSALVLWAKAGFPLPGSSIPSTAGKLAFVATKDGQTDVFFVDGKTGQNEQRLSSDSAIESELSFSPDGQKLAFAAERENVRQISIMDAAPERRIFNLTRTSSTKEAPSFASDGSVFFLDAGKIAKTTQDASDSDALFPTVEEKKENPILGELFKEGGIPHYTLSKDGHRLFAVVQRENAQILVVYDLEQKLTALLGAARKIQCQIQPDGSLIALFIEGAPIKTAVLPEPKNEAEQSGMLDVVGQFLQATANNAESLTGVYVLVRFNAQFEPSVLLPPQGATLPPLDGFSVAPDGKRVALFTREEHEGAPGGIYLGNLEDTTAGPIALFDRPCESVGWSPDGELLAFISGKSLWTVAPTEGATPTAIRKDGVSHFAWSPTLSSKKQ